MKKLNHYNAKQAHNRSASSVKAVRQDNFKNRSCYALALLFWLMLLPNAAFPASEEAETYYQNAIRQTGEASLEEVFGLYARAAELGHPIAQYNLAMMYSNGESVYVDYQQAVYWFKKSAQQEFAPAQYRLGEMYYFAKGGLPRDLDEAARLFRKAAEQDDPEAQMNLAMLCGSGEGLPLDTDQAIYWIEQAYSGGLNMAIDYRELLRNAENGRFTASQQERYWLEKAAELGVREAQQALSILRADTRPDD
jgi:TPR repeat protein